MKVTLKRNVPSSETRPGGVKISINKRNDYYSVTTLKQVEVLVTSEDTQRVWLEKYLPLNYEIPEGEPIELGFTRAGILNLDLKPPIILEYEY